MYFLLVYGYCWDSLEKEWVGKLSIPFFVKKNCPGAGLRSARTEKWKKNTLKKIKKFFKKNT